MKRLLFATTCLTLGSVTAQAQVAPPVYNWTGFYIGANVGAGKMTSSGASNTESVSNLPLAAVRAGISTLGFNTTDANGVGAVAGGQFGYNYQMGNWVFGVEGEGFWSGVKLTNNHSVFNSNGTVFETFGSSVKNNSDFTIAGRLGITFDRTLIYGKGGWAWGDHDFNAFRSCCNATPTTFSSSASGTLDGFLAGVGIEHALTRNWTVKFEYDYIGFGTKQLLVTDCSPTLCIPAGTSSVSTAKQIFKVGGNYMFNLP